MIPLVADCNHANPIDVDAVAGAGIVAIIHKASQGVTFTDHAYAQRRRLARTAGVEWGAYHFVSGENVKLQVENFFDAAHPDDRTVMVLDYEDNEKSQMSFAQMIEFLERADEKLGRPVDVYSGNRIKDTILHANPTQRAFLAKRRLWLCQYGPHAKLIDANGHPLPWAKYWLWQYTGDGVGPLPHTVAGLEKGADLSSYDGTAAELRANWIAKPAPALVA